MVAENEKKNEEVTSVIGGSLTGENISHDHDAQSRHKVANQALSTGIFS